MADRRHRNRRRAPTGVPAGRVPARAVVDVHVCPDCDSELVQPVQWAAIDSHRWRVELRCPDCDWNSVGFFPQEVLDRYDAILDEGAAAIQADLDRIERANMADDAESFIRALRDDLILPEDF